MFPVWVVGKKQLIVLGRLFVEMQMPLRLCQSPHCLGTFTIQRKSRLKTGLCPLPIFPVQIVATHVDVFFDHLLTRLVLRRFTRTRVIVILGGKLFQPAAAGTESAVIRSSVGVVSQRIRRSHRIAVRIGIPARRRPGTSAGICPRTGAAPRHSWHRDDRHILVFAWKRIVAGWLGRRSIRLRALTLLESWLLRHGSLGRIVRKGVFIPGRGSGRRRRILAWRTLALHRRGHQRQADHYRKQPLRPSN